MFLGSLSILDCYEDNGEKYRGHLSKTRSGIPCGLWEDHSKRYCTQLQSPPPQMYYRVMREKMLQLQFLWKHSLVLQLVSLHCWPPLKILKDKSVQPLLNHKKYFTFHIQISISLLAFRQLFWKHTVGLYIAVRLLFSIDFTHGYALYFRRLYMICIIIITQIL